MRNESRGIVCRDLGIRPTRRIPSRSSRLVESPFVVDVVVVGVEIGIAAIAATVGNKSGYRTRFLRRWSSRSIGHGHDL